MPGKRLENRCGIRLDQVFPEIFAFVKEGNLFLLYELGEAAVFRHDFFAVFASAAGSTGKMRAE
jgi:hypothetical protein